MCKTCGLDYDDLEIMTIGMCLDYMDEYIDQKTDNKTKQARQKDFDSF